MFTKYIIRKDKYDRLLWDVDGVVDEVYQLPGFLVGMNTEKAIEWCNENGYKTEKCILTKPTDEEKKAQELGLRRSIIHERWLEKRHWERFGDIEVYANNSKI